MLNGTLEGRPGVTGIITGTDYSAYYKIENAQDMPAFFINIATASDLWMFLSSGGALTAGRENADGAVFPYETDDRLHLAVSTGPKTVVRTADGRVWEPFDRGCDNPFVLRRNLYKRLTGDAVMFEEINETLGLRFIYRWETSEKYGLVRTAAMKNLTDEAVTVSVLDGVQNIIPHGISQGLADSSSCLTDAYKVCERYGNLCVYSLTSTIVDTPEPVEILHANVAWSLSRADLVLLSSQQIGAFQRGESLTDETRSFGRKCAYLTRQSITLSPGTEESWLLVIDARLSQTAVARLMKEVAETPLETLRAAVEADIAKGTTELLRNVGAADGLQCGENMRATTRHYMNVLYNNMRGGVFLDGYAYDLALFESFVENCRKTLTVTHKDFFDRVRASGSRSVVELRRLAYETGDADLIRLCLEFLPLTFSRRHGDPSRPWNRFHIRVKDANGNRVYHYEGNWRDIFQNWEAMSLSFPEYIEPIIAKFLNASTADGYNPYRISSDGVDWEVPEPHNPFSGYGYWGDHQIVYLNKLLEWVEAYAPERLARLMTEASFAYTEVPYEIKPYAELIQDGKDTIVFNYTRHERIMERTARMGADGKLMAEGDGVYYTSFMEKLLIPILAKLSNLVVGGGIWMNTQRPEWNDANNAIVGNGLSMVTVYQLYRHLLFCRKLAHKMNSEAFSASVEVKDWLDNVEQTLSRRGDQTARGVLDALGEGFGRYRAQIYVNGFSGRTQLTYARVAMFFDMVLTALAETIDANRREDGLYHAYNILQLTPGGLSVSPMFVMLEGQTAALGSGRLTPEDALALVAAMEASGLYSPEHKTFYLYPVKQLKTFLERNTIPSETAAGSALLTRLLADGANPLAVRDADGTIRFHESIRQSSDLEHALDTLAQDGDYAALVTAERETIREIYEQVFAHRQFTGRSGIMYKYEGIGSIYWHQNAKFLVSFQECISGAPTDSDFKALKETYYRLRAGFGFNKEPSLWGAFPLEPYSHTTYRMPAQQPGMTGQVKEDILTRYAELGLCVQEGVVGFAPALLDDSEFLQKSAVFTYVGTDGAIRNLTLEAGCLGFTVCQTPMVYRLAEKNRITAYTKDGSVLYEADGLRLDAAVSRSLFAREGVVERVVVEMTMAEIV